jgi:hypothetical protein
VLENYKYKLNDIKSRCNNIYNNITFTSIGDILEDVIDLDILDSEVYNMSTETYEYYKTISKKIENANLSDEDYDNLDGLAYDLYKDVDNKLTTLEDIVDDLKSLKERFDDNDSQKIFNDIKKLDI